MKNASTAVFRPHVPAPGSKDSVSAVSYNEDFTGSVGSGWTKMVEAEHSCPQKRAVPVSTFNLPPSDSFTVCGRVSFYDQKYELFVVGRPLL